MKYLLVSVFSLSALFSLNQHASAQTRQAPQTQIQQQQQQIQQLQVRGWRNLGFVEKIKLNTLKPLQCDYRLVQLGQNTPAITTFDFHTFEHATYINQNATIQFKKPLVLESASALFNAANNGLINYSNFLNYQRTGIVILCNLVMDSNPENKLYIECSGSGPDERVPGPDGEIITLPGAIFEGLDILDTNRFLLQERC